MDICHILTIIITYSWGTAVSVTSPAFSKTALAVSIWGITRPCFCLGSSITCNSTTGPMFPAHPLPCNDQTVIISASHDLIRHIAKVVFTPHVPIFFFGLGGKHTFGNI